MMRVDWASFTTEQLTAGLRDNADELGALILRMSPLVDEYVADAKHGLGYHGALLGVGDDV